MKSSNLTAEQIIRNINLYILSDIKLEEPYLSIFNCLENTFKDLKKYTYHKNPLDICYGKSKTNILFEYDGYTKQISMNYGDIDDIKAIPSFVKEIDIRKKTFAYYISNKYNLEIDEYDIQYSSTTGLTNGWVEEINNNNN